MMFCIYILKLNNNDLYKGFTSNLKERIKDHLGGRVRSTNKMMPRLIHYEAYIFESDARRRERFLKTTEGKRLLKQQIRDYLLSGDLKI